MKFKMIFILFNGIILFSFIFIFFMPYFILGWEYTQVFWSRNWFLVIIFVLVLAGLNVYFALNWKLFRLLEREDWSGLISYLETKIFNEKKIRSQYIRLLINANIITSRIDGIDALRNFLRENKPAMLPKFASQLGIPFIVQNHPEAMETFFVEFVDNQKTAEKEWVRWDYAFALFLQHKNEEAKREFIRLIGNRKNCIVSALSIYLLFSSSADNAEQRSNALAERDSFKEFLSQAKWNNRLEQNKSNVQVLLLHQLIQDAANWIYQNEENHE